MLTTEIQTINSFYLEKEAEFADLFNTRYAQEVKDMVISLSLSLVLSRLLSLCTPSHRVTLPFFFLCVCLWIDRDGGKLADPSQITEDLAEFRSFFSFCQRVDDLRNFTVLNYIGVMKICKKHDKKTGCPPFFFFPL